MQASSRTFRTAASSVARGWLQGAWSDERGYICGLQAVMDAMGIKDNEDVSKGASIPWGVLVEIDTTLVVMGTYCVGKKKQALRSKALAKDDAEQLSELIWLWNDQYGRTKAEVIEALEKTADRLESQNRVWLRELISRAIRPSSRRYAEDEELAYAGHEQPQ